MSRKQGSRSNSNRRNFRRSVKKSHKRFVRYGLLTANVALLMGAIVFVVQSPKASNIGKESALAVATGNAATDPLDELSSAEIAAHIAIMTDLPEAVSVSNNADSARAQLTISPADDKVIAKTQVVATEAKSYRDIKQYRVQEGDTVASIAEKFGITSDSVRWSNNISGNSVTVGRKLYIPPVSGIVYTVKRGDTVDSLANRYSVSKRALVDINDAEVGGLVVGRRIVLPDAVQPQNRPVFSSFSWGGYAAVYSNNAYDYGWCTWWASKRRQDIGRPIPSNLGNAISWFPLAQRAGLAVGGTPRAGAVVWHAYLGGLGHVAFVEKVNPDGSIWVSDMNYFGHVSMDTDSPQTGGWGRASYRLVRPGSFSEYRFIY